MKNRRNYYRILHVQPDAPSAVIRASYRAMMKDVGEHPDLGGLSERAVLLNEAYSTLANPKRRAAYDKTLFLQYTGRAALRGESARTPAISPFCPSCRTPLAPDSRGGCDCPSCGARRRPTSAATIVRQYRRAVLRTRREERIVYRSETSRGYREAQMIDISPRGMRLRCSEKLDGGQMLMITGARFEALAIVTNVRFESVGSRRTYAVGVTFQSVDFENSKGALVSTSA